MNHTSLPLSGRRQFLKTSATFSAGGILLPYRESMAASPEIGETDHFFYRLAPADGPYIDSQRENRAFGIGVSEGRIFLSEDNGKSWPHQVDFPDAANIMFSCLLGNGNVVFATKTRIYLSTDGLKSYRELKVVDRNGKPYPIHTPLDPNRPGSYFYSLDGNHTWEVEGREMMIWGNYCNVRHGLVPVNIYYSTDQGQTIKIAYSFGQNPHFQQKKNKDEVIEPLLGAADNPVICRHVHSVSYNPAENAFYACCGDIDRGHGKECHWLRGTYDTKADHWEWKVVVSSDANSRFKSGGINFVNGQVYWVADANGPKTIRETYDRGIFRCDPADLADKSKHTRLFPAKYELAAMTIDENVILAPHYGRASPYDTGFIISPDLGKTWEQYDLKEFGERSGVRVSPRNSEGWFRVGLRKRWMDRGEVLFIKPK